MTVSLVASSCYLNPDLYAIWNKIRNGKIPPFLERTLEGSASSTPRTFRVFNPDLLAQLDTGIPILVLDAYEDMYGALKTANESNEGLNDSQRLFYVGQPGIGKASFPAQICVSTR